MTKLSFDWSYEGALRAAALEDELGEIGGGVSAIGGWAQAKRRRNEAIKALHAFGEAIASVARAQMTSEISAGRTIVADLGARTLELWQCGGSLCLSEYSDLAPRRLREIKGQPEDIAAEAVAALIEECER